VTGGPCGYQISNDESNKIALTDVCHTSCMICIMRRTQLYLDDSLWNALHAHAQTRKTTLSELVREAVRERYLGKREEQVKAMREFVGIRKPRAGELDAVEVVRAIRRGETQDDLPK
jgi:hypothetical protein